MNLYTKHFGLSREPFSIAPNPRFLYMSRQHREALAHLTYGVRSSDGFAQLTGEVGTGKTTICRCLVERLPEEVDVALILNPRVTALELVETLCDELHIDYPKNSNSIKLLTDVLNAFLLENHAAGRRTVLIIDEAQCLSAETLEQVRLLTNLETATAKLLQIILVGQPELRELLARDDLRQLAQRITARYHLLPFTRAETAAYIRHRLDLSGALDAVFDERVIDTIHRMSKGIPRLINVLCDRAMLGAFAEGVNRVDSQIMRKASAEVLPEDRLDGARPSSIWRGIGVALVVILGLSLAGGLWYGMNLTRTPAADDVADIADTPTEPPAAQPHTAKPVPGPAPEPEVAATLASTVPRVADDALQETLRPADTTTVDVDLPVASTPQMTAAPVPTAIMREPPAQPPVIPGPTLAETVIEAPPEAPETAAANDIPVSRAEPAITASVAAAQTSPAAPSLAKHLAAASSEAEAHAWSGLYRLWGYASAARTEAQACAQSGGAGLSCLQGIGSWGMLQRFDRPAILDLRAGGRRLVPAVLQRAGGDQVTLEIDGEVITVPRTDLEQRWEGAYRLLWKVPPSGQTSLRPGTRGDQVRWLRERLAQVIGANADVVDPARYDEALVAQVVALQNEHNLDADGIAGPLTLIVLNNLFVDPEIPHLAGRAAASPGSE